jgi:tripartite-type tricarboxylate transporter receptor subunit TctC
MFRSAMKAVLCAALCALAAVSTVATAETFPTKPIHIVVPFAPGGGSDAVARALSNKLAQALGQSVVVENKPGAGGLLATAFVASSPADGYTLLLVDTSFAANISLYAKPGYGLGDFAPVALVASVPSFVVVGQHVPAKSIADLVALAKAKPGALNMASGGAGGMSHLIAARFAGATGVTWTHVPYRGVGPAMMDVIGGQADVLFSTAPAVIPHLKSGRVRALAVTSATRSPLAPEVPTLAELGMPTLTGDNWYGIVAPAKTDPAVVRKLLDNLNAAVRSPEVRPLLIAQMVSPTTAPTSLEFETLLKRETEIWAKTVKSANISPN